jgi:hypothetical protein
MIQVKKQPFENIQQGTTIIKIDTLEIKKKAKLWIN